MEPLNEQENEILKLLCEDKVSLEDFLIESKNPRFLYALNGNNSSNLNIFQTGFPPQTAQWQNHSRFWLPAMYLEKIANRLHQETSIEDLIRREYESYIRRALHDIIRGYAEEGKTDLSVIQSILHIIQTQDIKSLDEELFDFMIKNLKGHNSSLVVRNILPIIKNMLVQRENIERVKKFIELMTELLPNEYTSSDDRTYFIEEFLLHQEVVASLADICENAFLSNLANMLVQTLEQRKEISLKDEIKIKIQDDCSLKISIANTSIQFVLPYVELKEKYKIIKPIIEKKLQDYCGADKNILIQKILYWYTYVWSDFTYISYPSLYHHSKGYNQCRQAVLIYLIKEILLLTLKTQGVEKFLEIYQVITSRDKYFIFKRMFLYCYGKDFKNMRTRLFSLLKQEKSLLFSLYFEAEVYGLLEENVVKFTLAEKKEIEEIIEGGPYSERIWEQNKRSHADGIKVKNFWKQGWYAALNTIEPFSQRYKQLREQTHMKEFFNFRDGMEMRPLHYNSLLEDMKVLSLLESEPSEYVTTITQFVKTQPNRVLASLHEMPHAEGNAEQLQRLADKYPAIITESITELSTLNPVYIRHILYGLRTTKDRQNIKWEKLCSFIENYVDNLSKNEQHFADMNENEEDVVDVPKGRDIESIISAWADIISIPEDKEYFDISKIQRLLLKFLKLILKNYSFNSESICCIQDGEKYPVDYLTLSINTAMGRVLEKLIRVVLSIDVRNLKILKDIYEEILEKKVVEAHVFLGLYFIFFYQNLEEWTKEKTNFLLKLSSNEETLKYWEMFFEGFIKSNNQYLDYYEWMFEHYKRAIEVYNVNGQSRLIDALVQFFENDKDLLDNNSLIRFGWEKKAFHVLSGCVREISFPLNKGKLYGYTPNKKDVAYENQIIPKVQKMWDFLWDQIEREHILPAESSSEQKELFVNMLELIPALPVLDNSTEGKVSQLINCVETSVGGMSNLFSNLIYLVEKSVREKCEIFNLAKLYYQIIQKMDYFTIVDTHFKIIEMLKKHLDIPGVAHQLDLIRAVYVTKKWSRYLDWFE